MDTGSFMRVVVEGYLYDPGQTWINTWTLRCQESSDANALQNIGSYIVPAFFLHFYDPLRVFFSNQAVATKVTLREYGNEESGYDWVGSYPLNSTPGQTLPNFVTYSVQVGRNSYAFRPGRKGLPGALTGRMGLDGRMIPADRGLMNTQLENWVETMNVEAGAATYEFGYVLVKNATDIDVVPTVWTQVTSAQVNGFGTQNTRKD